MARGGNMQLRALDSVWIQFSNASGEVLLARVLAVDEVVPVPEGTDIRLTASDAGALVVLLNGERLPALGAAGEILRDLSLDPAELRARANR
jgi:cytoskeleton protein RodZ